MNVSSVTTFGSPAIASPPANDGANTRLNDQPADAAPVQVVEAAKSPGTGQVVDIKV